MKYGIVAFPSKKTQDLANHYRKRYDTHYAQVPPHITLLESFEADESHTTTIVATLDKLAKRFAPLQIQSSRVSSFAPVTNAIYFKVEPTKQLQSFHEALTEQLQHNPRHVFTPHITIGQDMSDQEHDDVLGQLRMIGVDVQETIDRVHLLYQLDNGSWTTHETFILTGEE